MTDNKRDQHIRMLEQAARLGAPGTSLPRGETPTPKQQKRGRKK